MFGNKCILHNLMDTPGGNGEATLCWFSEKDAVSGEREKAAFFNETYVNPRKRYTPETIINLEHSMMKPPPPTCQGVQHVGEWTCGERWCGCHYIVLGHKLASISVS